MESIKLALVALFLCFGTMIDGYGYRYRFDPITQQTQLWTYLPGFENPLVYDNELLVQSKATAFENPGLFKYYSNGRLRWKCKIDAYYSEYQQRCFWKAGRFPISKTG